jgi:hypothetical protein
MRPGVVYRVPSCWRETGGVTATAMLYGHDVYWHIDAQEFRFVDTDQPAHKPPLRPCPLCNQPPTPQGYDACLGYVPGALSVCCGHGRVPASILWLPEVEERREAFRRDTEGMLDRIMDLLRQRGDA